MQFDQQSSEILTKACEELVSTLCGFSPPEKHSWTFNASAWLKRSAGKFEGLTTSEEREELPEKSF
jgi:hypothetical protein